MNKQYEIEEGLVDRYVLGLTSNEETLMMNELATEHSHVQALIDELCLAIEKKAMEVAVQPPITLRPHIFATIDYIDRMSKGEPPSYPPLLSESSSVDDFAEWLNRPDMVLPADFNAIHTKLIAHTAEANTAIVWLGYIAPDEVHHDEHERFLIVEGTCTITIENVDHNLVPGDYLAIPLYANHLVVVTSPQPCKIILQRVAA
jgi:mannose-6-phosphate isomerase-like protein (cupin superfamily)